jgi:hypothetical protein
MEFLNTIDWVSHSGHIAYALVVLLLIINIATMANDAAIVPKTGAAKSYYGMDITILVFLLLGFVLDFFLHKCK